MIYFTSDLHLGHDREFIYKDRGYDNIREMSEDIIKIINDTVKFDDDLYILGDLMLNDDKYGYKLLSQIKCSHLHIILGNHCSKSRQQIYQTLWNLYDIKYADYLVYGKWSFMLSHYPMITGDTNTDNKHTSNRVYSLCGHVHTKDKFLEMKKGIPAYHVEWDAHGKPVSIEEIIEDIRKFYM